MFKKAAAFNQDLSGWNVANGQSFVSTRRILLVCYDAYYSSQLFYCLRSGSLQRKMFKDSGMNYFIGKWDFKLMGNDAGSLSVFVSVG